MTATTFRDAYGVLQRHANTLRNQQEPNIDDLLDIVTESVGAYKVCKERIDAVEKALEQALGNVGVEPVSIPSASVATTAQSADAPVAAASSQQEEPPVDDDDDLPF
ncbi:exodeoxyribonuclease VII small subunit [Propionivibrio sp.]|uniref:exodeoxyribonuclease VII small subunit n=1 Tax=Propionivibrio sp. TaxID=2212460 RepID=UPI003BF3B3A9